MPTGAEVDVAHGTRRRSDPLRPRFLHDYHDKTELDRTILNHLLHQTFAGEDERRRAGVGPDPRPEPRPGDDPGRAGRYPFRDVQAAYQQSDAARAGTVPFLSTRRCRHFLASIAPRCSAAIAETPDPDMALVNLEKVTASLGAKAVLWELFSFNPPSLKLYVDLCAWSQFLSEILINNPGMIDELLDSLVLNQPRTAEELRAGADRAVPGRRPISSRSCTASRTRSCCASACATSSARTRSSETTRGAERSGRDDPGADRGAAVRAAGDAVRRAAALPRARAGQPSRFVAAGAGQARRPGDELSQRSRFDPHLRRRRPDRAAAGRHRASTASS